MSILAQKQHQPQKPASIHLARSHTPARGLHRYMGNNPSLLPLVLTEQEELNAGVAAVAPPRFGHDFHQIPIHPSPAGAIQTKLVINKPGDNYEQEADHVVAAIMHMQPPPLQRACSCGKGGSTYQMEEPELAPERVQAKHIHATQAGETIAPPIVHDGLRSPGQPLDMMTRAFMEPRFGHDFGRVQVHINSHASASARALNAHAYTVKNHIVFGANQYQPSTNAGRQLLAHELTHVVQQQAGDRLATALAVNAPTTPTVMKADDGSTPRFSGCSQGQIDAIEAARRAAAIRCQRAAFQTKGIVPPAPPGRGDPGEVARRRAQQMVRTIFGEDLNMEQVGDIVTSMGARLASANLTFTCAPSNDPNCGNRAGYVVGNRAPIHLCPTFFNNSSAEERIRTMVHEAAHLGGIGEAIGETYCPIFDCATTCGGFDVADSWSHYVHCMSDQTPDQPEVIQGGTP